METFASKSAKVAIESGHATAFSLDQVKEKANQTSDSIVKLGEKSKTTLEALKDEFGDFSSDATDSLNEVADKIIDITKKMNDLTLGKAKDDADLRKEYAEAFVREEEK